jgi:hypothetical protein
LLSCFANAVVLPLIYVCLHKQKHVLQANLVGRYPSIIRVLAAEHPSIRGKALKRAKSSPLYGEVLALATLSFDLLHALTYVLPEYTVLEANILAQIAQDEALGDDFDEHEEFIARKEVVLSCLMLTTCV